MIKASTLTFLALTCLSCNPLVINSSDAGIPDAGTEKDSGTEVSYTFEPQKIVVACTAEE
tara:strand:- start:12783 stop:12962 length:180 start_codon:yes stop_codon:yes gene_type:complete